MSRTDDVLAAIDHAVHDFEISEDAMRWNPEPPSPRLGSLRPAGAEDATRRFGEAFREMAAGLQPTIAQLTIAMRPMIEFARSPAGQVLLAAARDNDPTDQEQGCHCLCAVRHPDQQVCEGAVLVSEVVTIRIRTVDVRMCPSCAKTPRSPRPTR